MEPEERRKMLKNWESRIITANLKYPSMLGMYFFMLSVTIVMILLMLNEQ